MEIYANAPITEAALDIRIRSSVDLTEVDLNRAKDAAYPDLFRRPTKIQIKVEDDEVMHTAAAETSSTFLGLSFRSKDQKDIYQVRNDGFTHNRLAPYQEWDLFCAEARRLWEIYRSVVKPETIELIGLNYVNEILIPAGSEFKEYFQTYVEVPPKLPQQINTFAIGYQLTLPGGGGFIHIGQTYGPPRKENFTTVILSIQAFKNLNISSNKLEEEELWSSFEELRKAKSNAFEECITDKVREIIR